MRMVSSQVASKCRHLETLQLCLLVLHRFHYREYGSFTKRDSLASILNFIAVRHSLSPADDEHRFGHGKAEPLAGLGQAAFIMGSSLFLIFEAINRFVNPQAIQYGQIGIVVMLISLGLNQGAIVITLRSARTVPELPQSAKEATRYAPQFSWAAAKYLFSPSFEVCGGSD